MPTALTAEQLEAAGGPIAAGLLPAWRVKWVALSQEQIDSLDERRPGPNLAIVQTLPERRMATVNIVSPWPDGESLEETLMHELGHVWIAPITAQIPDTEASVMLEEQLVETLGVYLAGLSKSAAARARRALARVVEAYAPPDPLPRFDGQVAFEEKSDVFSRLRSITAPSRYVLSRSFTRRPKRAKILARAQIRARGGSMDGKQVLAAIAGQDEAAALKILSDWVAEQLEAAGHPSAPEPDGDEPGAAAELPKPGEGEEEPMSEDPKAKPAAPVPGPETPAEPPARTAARRAALDAEHARARKAADATVSITVRARIRELRQDGVTLPTNLEASLAKMTDLDAFEQRVSDLLEGRKLAAPAGTRARATAPNGPATPAPVEHDDGPAIVEDAALKAEGFDDNFVNLYKGAAAHSRKNAEALLSGARARRASHRAAPKGIAS